MATFVASLGFTIIGLVPSPIEGGDGNREFLLGARRG
jgi:23S rRNA (cytidine1920-2'-O)/16S rRNA (cytidine1409-2'-O)-methyltransferase